MEGDQSMKSSNAPLHRSHPWHGLPLGEDPPNIVNCYIEMVPTDTVKYEIDKESGLLKVDRPQKYSSLCPSLYGFLPRTYAGDRVAEYCMEKSGRSNLKGDADPIDICVLTEKSIIKGDLILRSVPIGGFRLLDGNEVDDKIISVMVGDFVYGDISDIKDCPENLVERLRHYFLTYKDAPEREDCVVRITDIYDAEEAKEVIRRSSLDYLDYIKQ